jgi:choline kinase
MTQTLHAIVLVAGEGKRLLPFTLTAPKCFATVRDTTILENTLRSLAAGGCKKVVIVVGHHAQLVRDTITEDFAGMSISFVVNPEYQTTNSMYSLALGLEACEAPCWVIEGDVFFEPSLLNLDSPADIAWYVDSTTRGLDGAFVGADESGKACSLDIIRDLSLLDPGQSKSVGMLHLTSHGAACLRNWLQDAVKAGRNNDYYDLIIRDHLDQGIVYVVDVAAHKWFEIDTPADLEIARKLFT